MAFLLVGTLREARNYARIKSANPKKTGKNRQFGEIPMGRKWNNIKYAKAAKDANRSKIYAKFGREIYVAAKSGEPDPESNRNLRVVLERAKTYKVPRDIIDRAIDKAKGGSDEAYEPMRYEGYGPGGSALIVDALTDNVNRTFPEVRAAFGKNGGNIGVSGSVAFMFESTALIGFSGKTDEEVLDALVEADCDFRDVEVQEDGSIMIYTDPEYFHAAQEAMKAIGIEEFTTAELTMLPAADIVIEDEAVLAAFEKLVDALEDLDDVQQVYHNVEL